MDDTEMLTIVRQRLHAVEQAAIALIDVTNRTGTERMAAFEALQRALVTDFDVAVICSPDMKDEDRAHWLAVCEEDKAARAASGGDADARP